jgi:hypothetical protein
LVFAGDLGIAIMGSGKISQTLWTLKIATTVFFGLLSVAFFVLWVRSYWYVESGRISTVPGQHVAFNGGSGRMCVWFEHSPTGNWNWNTRVNEREPIDPSTRIPVFHVAFFWPAMTRLYVAHWFLTVVTVSLAAVLWLPRKFSNRGFMIAFTLVAVIIAAIAYIDRTF